MEEKKPIQTEALASIAGGNETLFTDEGKPACPVCGKVGIERVDSYESYDVYHCSLCGQNSIHQKVCETMTSCPVCGCTGEGFRVIRTEGSTEIMKCAVCGQEFRRFKG